MNSTPMTGGCLCGHVRYEASGAAYDIAHCHCQDCRRSSGAPFVTWASFKRSEFRFSCGQPKEVRWAHRIRSFCPECGTPLLFQSSPDSGEIDVAVSTLDHPEELTPSAHIWVEDRLPWIKLEDGLPAYSRKRIKSPADTLPPQTKP